MAGRTFAVLFLLAVSAPLHASSLVLSSVFNDLDSTHTVKISALDLVDAAGLNLSIEFDNEVLSCSWLEFFPSRLPGFISFFHKIDNAGGRVEVLLLRPGTEGLDGNAESLLEVRFKAESGDASTVAVTGWDSGPEPVLVNSLNEAQPISGSGLTVPTDSGTPSSGTRLRQNYPNPFNPATTISFELSEPSDVSLRIYDPAGRLLRTLIEGERYEAGRWSREWDGMDGEGNRACSGVYFCVFKAGGHTESRKLVVLR